MVRTTTTIYEFKTLKPFGINTVSPFSMPSLDFGVFQPPPPFYDGFSIFIISNNVCHFSYKFVLGIFYEFMLIFISVQDADMKI